MFYTNEITTFNFQNEHDLEHDLPVKNIFSNPKIYTANGDLKKRWYVYFSFRNPDSGKLLRMKNIYGIANKYKTKEERLSILTTYRRNLLKLLKEGFNPFQDNTELFEKRNLKKELVPEDRIINSGNKIPVKVEKPAIGLKEAFDFALKLKEKIISDSTKRGYTNKANNFIDWLMKNYPDIKTIDQLSKGAVISFLNKILQNTSARNRNNYRVDLSSLMQTMEDNDMVKMNIIKKIPVLKTTPERNKTYSEQLQKDIYVYLEIEDPLLLLYIKFISYNFLRPIEVCRLKIKDINLKSKVIQFKAKNKLFKTKIIPDLLLNEIPDLSKMDPEHYLFTPEGLGGKWITSEDNKRNYFSKRFRIVVKDPFKLGSDYGLYSFRHTFITKLYREMVKNTSPFEAKSNLMLITGHTSLTALEKYLRDIDAELPADYSHLLQ